MALAEQQTLKEIETFYDTAKDVSMGFSGLTMKDVFKMNADQLGSKHIIVNDVNSNDIPNKMSGYK